MTDDRLTPEERAVIDMACRWRDHWRVGLDSGDDDSTPTPWLRDAVDAYRKSIAPPEPFEAYLAQITETSWGTPFPSVEDLRSCERPVWRCTVTPVERVR